MLETTSDLNQFLSLQEKTEVDLQQICKKLSLNPDAAKDDLIQQIVHKLQEPPKSNFGLFPLRTRGVKKDTGKLAYQAMLRWRHKIFNTYDNTKSFKLLKQDGTVYQKQMRHVICSNQEVGQILFNDWLLPVTQLKSVLQDLKQSPRRFDKYIVQYYKKDKSFIMLYVERKNAQSTSHKKIR